MDTPIKKMTPEERENVLLVLNEFSEEYKGNTKAVADLVAGVKDLTGKIKVLLEKKEQGPDTESPLAELHKSLYAGIEKIHTAVQRIALPTKEVNQLSGQLEATKSFLQHPVPPKTVYQQYTPTIIGVAAGLFLSLCLVCSGWYQTAGKLNQYQEGQLKYRYLKLTSKSSTKQILWSVDSLYRAGDIVKDSVTEWEAQREKAAELNERLDKNMGEGSNLQQQLEKLEQQKRDREQY